MKFLTHIKGTEKDFILNIDNSTLESFTTCPRAFQYFSVERKELSGRRVPLDFGKIMHNGWEIRFNGDEDWEVQQRAQLIQEMSQLEGDDRRCDVNYALYCMEQYNEAHPYAAEPFQVAKDEEGKPMVELPFTVNIGEIDIQSPEIGKVYLSFSGKIDAVVKWDGVYWILDHKTSSMEGQSFYDDFILSSQIHGYCFAAEKTLGIPIHGFVLDALFTRNKPATSRGKGVTAERQRYPFEQPLLDEWRKDFEALACTMLGYHHHNYFPKATKWCFGKFGRCQFHDVCSMPKPEDRVTILNSDQYQTATWSPLNP